MGGDGVRGEQLAVGIDHRDLHARAQARIETHGGACAGGGGEQQIAQVHAEHLDRFFLGRRAQRVGLGASGAAGPLNRLAGKVVNTAYLGGTAAYLIESSGIRLQAITLIDGRVLREGDSVEIGIAPGDCTLLDSSGKRVDRAPA